MKSTSSSARLQNDFGADLWVKNRPKHHPTAGRGLFAGLQDTKNYNVESGWAKRSTAESQGFLGGLLSRFIGGAYKPPTE
ncbi:uncharacterized protein AKAW2_70555S [Aspergillus luchuensis]|uniref:Acyl-CoA thioesterase II n=1 Tax=Aspergillus kawachii TaxID=1069201 RepID=A0A146FSK4_ASPKA|nr:uncharacterized protein AKAW2_70555S [Aspergillus luchuensis]BCS03677.1 hypothetical protein AKAW2_70555S [Aspergillus luchuensis]BCS15298.1 hypothetical protein ALUC_70531S [Aspergillus luchuensis]GAT28824.1 acyl-CoA thioesterase II [Aspergillus luchuensis]